MSFSEASRQLYISQSAVSQSIKSLEQKLGHQLFVRRTKKISLTPEGETLYRHIIPAIHMIETAEAQITENNTLNGQLRIAASDTICRYFLVPFLNRFHTEYPNVHIKVVNLTSSMCVDLLKQNQVDVIIANTPTEQLKKCAYTYTVYEFRDVFVANPRYFNLTGLSLDIIDQLPFITLERNTASSRSLHNIFRKYGKQLIPEIELSSNDLVLDLTKIGLGIGILPDYMLKNKEVNLRILNTDFDIPKRQLVLATNDTQESNPILQEFLTYFISEK